LINGTSIILDSSVALSWFFKDESNDYADAVLANLAQATAIVPTIWPLEIANALLVGERRGRSTAEQALTWTILVSALPIAIDNETAGFVFDAILSIGRAHSLSAYDAAYIELAARRGLRLATLDTRLRKAAGAAGIALFSAE